MFYGFVKSWFNYCLVFVSGCILFLFMILGVIVGRRCDEEVCEVSWGSL